MKTFKAFVTGWRVVLVEAETEDDALRKLGEEFDTGGWEMETGKVECEISGDEIARQIKHGAEMLEA